MAQKVKKCITCNRMFMVGKRTGVNSNQMNCSKVCIEIYKKKMIKNRNRKKPKHLNSSSM